MVIIVQERICVGGIERDWLTGSGMNLDGMNDVHLLCKMVG